MKRPRPIQDRLITYASVRRTFSVDDIIRDVYDRDPSAMINEDILEAARNCARKAVERARRAGVAIVFARDEQCYRFGGATHASR